MLEVFKTNVEEADKAIELIWILDQAFPGNRINFDLDDCDKVLRVEGLKFCTQTIITLVKSNGFACVLME
ncbi:MAG TPA: hypothetical protein PKM63_03200 [Panacibacter sp.]|nr:hypothetical protein [Panacibacter sp.]HNP43265.1 hypothetical protein [Panacibacter sp.]